MRHNFLRYGIALTVFAACLLICGCDRKKADCGTNSDSTEDNLSVSDTSDIGEAVTENPTSATSGGSANSEKSDKKTDSSEKTSVAVEIKAEEADSKTASSASDGNFKPSESMSDEQSDTESEQTVSDGSEASLWAADGDGYYDFKIH